MDNPAHGKWKQPILKQYVKSNPVFHELQFQQSLHYLTGSFNLHTFVKYLMFGLSAFYVTHSTEEHVNE